MGSGELNLFIDAEAQFLSPVLKKEVKSNNSLRKFPNKNRSASLIVLREFELREFELLEFELLEFELLEFELFRRPYKKGSFNIVGDPVIILRILLTGSRRALNQYVLSPISVLHPIIVNKVLQSVILGSDFIS